MRALVGLVDDALENLARERRARRRGGLIEDDALIRPAEHVAEDGEDRLSHRRRVDIAVRAHTRLQCGATAVREHEVAVAERHDRERQILARREQLARIALHPEEQVPLQQLPCDIQQLLRRRRVAQSRERLVDEHVVAHAGDRLGRRRGDRSTGRAGSRRCDGRLAGACEPRPRNDDMEMSTDAATSGSRARRACVAGAAVSSTDAAPSASDRSPASPAGDVVADPALQRAARLERPSGGERRGPSSEPNPRHRPVPEHRPLSTRQPQRAATGDRRSRRGTAGDGLVARQRPGDPHGDLLAAVGGRERERRGCVAPVSATPLAYHW